MAAMEVIMLREIKNCKAKSAVGGIVTDQPNKFQTHFQADIDFNSLFLDTFSVIEDDTMCTVHLIAASLQWLGKNQQSR